jgi:hypothetical protein
MRLAEAKVVRAKKLIAIVDQTEVVVLISHYMKV